MVQEDVPAGDDIVADLLRDAPKLDENMDTILVLDGLPQVGKEKEAKLATILTNMAKSAGGELRDQLWMPFDDATGTSKGFAFVEFETADGAQRALRKLDRYQMDKKHIIAATLVSDFAKFEKVPEEYTPLTVEDFDDSDNMRYWLQDKRCIDQYVVRHAHMTSVFQNTRDTPTVEQERANWSDAFVVWSPKGTYMATFHAQGVVVWGGQRWKKINRFAHPGVKFIQFSPSENYVVTFAPSRDPASEEAKEDIAIWDVLSGQKMRTFAPIPNYGWPQFKWSSTDSHFARLGEDRIAVYETPSMELMGKKSIKIEGVRNLEFSPTSPQLACWVPEIANNPARVLVYEIPSRKVLRAKNLYNVTDCQLHWQEQGDFMCVKVDRKKKKTTFTNFELFRMREREIPVDVVEFRETITAFAWEPCGNRFALVHGDSPEIKVSFYSVDAPENGGKLTKLLTVEKKPVNCLFWSPKGQYIVLAGLRNFNGAFEFWDVDELVCMNQGEHFMCTDVAWDPTGRYIATSVSCLRHEMENAYNLWSSHGRLISRHPTEKLYMFSWRPRPASLLSDAQKKDIKKRLKSYSTKFDLADRMSTDLASRELIDRRRKLMTDFKAYRAEASGTMEKRGNEHAELLAAKTVKVEVVEDGVETEEFVKQHIEVMA